MRWTKLKQLAEDLLCEKLQGRLHYHLVIHRKSHDQTATFRVTLDGQEVCRASDIPYARQTNERGRELQEERKIVPFKWEGDWQSIWESDELKQLHAAYDDAELEVKASGQYPAWEVVPLLFDYVQMSEEKAIVHEHPFIRAVAVLDRRVGKRTLEQLDVKNEADVVKLFYSIRTES
ncbi:hypothetical protein NCCP2222_26610 [Sporosarcina sp. NCCP-2222]|uniref:SF0329 family protein n=1 Tax=Sporosarcina sp. NCCP-2222 TaxID=2935073 RepID=UPI0020882D8B|nr:hypothetical protein [Sporosarcina sp. NCCP-2222]GKV56714.1 hypothetical protein NCCP2222_26610 [Sporosarcina sp. NCCP-2222]